MIVVEDRLIAEKVDIHATLLQPLTHGQQQVEVVMTTTKVCKTCGETKDIESFYKRKDGWRRGSCKPCNSKKYKTWRKSKPSGYESWMAMRSRCNNPNDPAYSRYGGRGISVCKEWDSFGRFMVDMGSRPTSRRQIDRTNNDGNYEPSNCKWVLPIENARNRRNNKLDKYKAEEIRNMVGKGIKQEDIARKFGICGSMVCQIKKGMSWRTQEC